MEKLIFRTKRSNNYKSPSMMVRIDAEVYEPVSYIANQTRLPVARVASYLLDFAIRNAELDSAKNERDLLELYKKTPPMILD